MKTVYSRRQQKTDGPHFFYVSEEKSCWSSEEEYCTMNHKRVKFRKYTDASCILKIDKFKIIIRTMFKFPVLLDDLPEKMNVWEWKQNI